MLGLRDARIALVRIPPPASAVAALARSWGSTTQGILARGRCQGHPGGGRVAQPRRLDRPPWPACGVPLNRRDRHFPTPTSSATEVRKMRKRPHFGNTLLFAFLTPLSHLSGLTTFACNRQHRCLAPHRNDRPDWAGAGRQSPANSKHCNRNDHESACESTVELPFRQNCRQRSRRHSINRSEFFSTNVKTCALGKAANHGESEKQLPIRQILPKDDLVVAARVVIPEYGFPFILVLEVKATCRLIMGKAGGFDE